MSVSDGDRRHARLNVRRTGNRELFVLGPIVKEARDQFSIIKVKNRRGEDLSEFKAKPKAQQIPEARPMAVERWNEIYLDMEETKSKRSYERDCQLVQPLKHIPGRQSLAANKTVSTRNGRQRAAMPQAHAEDCPRRQDRG